MNPSSDLDEVYGQLTHLCEQPLGLSHEASLCLMEAFNDLSEVHLPILMWSGPPTKAVERIARSLKLLDALIYGSGGLQQTLDLMRVRELVRRAGEGQP